MTAFTIKIIAITTMLIDHAGAVFDLPIETRIIGRIAFPLFVYLIAEGCKHTRSMEKYLLRLGIFALVSEIPFDLAFNQIPGQPILIDFLSNTNIFYTLFLGVACVYTVQKIWEIRRPAMWILIPFIIITAMAAAEFFSTDYGYRGVLFIFCTAMVSKYKLAQLGVIILFSFWLYLPRVMAVDFAVNPVPFYMLISCLLAVPVAAFANGGRGRPVKWLFYVTYPAHLLLFWAVALILS